MPVTSKPPRSTQPKGSSRILGTVLAVAFLVVVAMAAMTHRQWKPAVDRVVASFRSGDGGAAHDDHATPRDDHAGHDDHTGHAHEDHGSEDSLKLTAMQRRNIGLKTTVVQPSRFQPEVVVPAVVAERPGRSQVEIAAHAAGIVADIYPLERHIVQQGMPLIQMQLVHEDIVGLQTDFLKTLSRKDIHNRELRRLRQIGSDIVPGKRMIDKENEIAMVESELVSIRQSMKLHGIDENKIEQIERTRKLVDEEIVEVPSWPIDPDRLREGIEFPEPVIHVRAINIRRGQTVQLGQQMMTLADFSLLYLKGEAFEDDARRLVDATANGQRISVNTGDGNNDTLQLTLESLADTIDPETRTLAFYLLLPNELMRDTKERASGGASVDTAPLLPISASGGGAPRAGHDFIAWKYRPGQRMEVRIPRGDAMENKIVLPSDAVVIDGPNAFVFEQNGEHFDRVEVQVLQRDNDRVVLENDGSLIGATVAIKGAYRMHLAIRNAAGGGIDPHAGHSH